MTKDVNVQIIDFVKQTTVAITIIAESNKQLVENTGALKEMINTQNITNTKSFESINGKMDGLLTMFKYVIAPLIGAVLAIAGIKTLFKL